MKNKNPVLKNNALEDTLQSISAMDTASHWYRRLVVMTSHIMSPTAAVAQAEASLCCYQ